MNPSIMKHLILILALLFSSIGFTQKGWEPIADSVVSAATSQLGTPYKWGTSNPNVSFDCSGFTAYAYGSANVDNSRSSKAYATLGEQVLLAECRKGDCILFSGTSPGSKTPGHVGIVVSNTADGIQFIHCSSSKNHYGVVITDYYSSNYPKRFLQVRRLFE